MAVLPIHITGDPVLHNRAQEVTKFDDDLRRLVADMFDTMDLAPGVGLAAPQVGVALRVFVYDYPAEDGALRRGAVINPELELAELLPGAPDEDHESEGCLSVPGERFPLRRYHRAILTGLDLNQNPLKIEATGWFARIFQHEFDHLNGTLYTDRLAEPWKTMATSAVAENGWGEPGHTWLPGIDNLED